MRFLNATARLFFSLVVEKQSQFNCLTQIQCSPASLLVSRLFLQWYTDTESQKIRDTETRIFSEYHSHPQTHTHTRTRAHVPLNIIAHIQENKGVLTCGDPCGRGVQHVDCDSWHQEPIYHQVTSYLKRERERGSVAKKLNGKKKKSKIVILLLCKVKIFFVKDKQLVNFFFFVFPRLFFPHLFFTPSLAIFYHLLSHTSLLFPDSYVHHPPFHSHHLPFPSQRLGIRLKTLNKQRTRDGK